MQFAHYRLDKWLDSREVVIHLPSCIAPLRRLIAQNSQPHHIILIQFILPLLIAANSRCQPKPQESMRFQMRMEPWPSKSSQLYSLCLITKYIFFSFKNKHFYHFKVKPLTHSLVFPPFSLVHYHSHNEYLVCLYRFVYYGHFLQTEFYNI